MKLADLERELRQLQGRYKLSIDTGDLTGALVIRGEVGKLALREMGTLLNALQFAQNPLNAEDENAPEKVPF